MKNLKNICFLFFLIPFFLTAQCPPKLNLVFSGNSLFQKWPVGDIGENSPTYVFQKMKKLGYQFADSVNISVLNQNIGGMDAQKDELKNLIKTTSKNIIIPYEGCNTIAQWGWNEKQFTNWLFGYIRYCKQIGYEVVVPTQFAYDAEWSYDTVNFKAYFRYQFAYSDTVRLAANRIIRDSQKLIGYTILDLAAIDGFKTLSDTKNRNLYYDGLHLTQTGRERIADTITRVLDRNLCNYLQKISPLKDELHEIVTIYPNPTYSGNINISKVASYELYDILGRLIERNSADNVYLPQKGIYFIKIGNQFSKIIRY